MIIDFLNNIIVPNFWFKVKLLYYLLDLSNIFKGVFIFFTILVVVFLISLIYYQLSYIKYSLYYIFFKLLKILSYRTKLLSNLIYCSIVLINLISLLVSFYIVVIFFFGETNIFVYTLLAFLSFLGFNINLTAFILSVKFFWSNIFSGYNFGRVLEYHLNREFYYNRSIEIWDVIKFRFNKEDKGDLVVGYFRMICKKKALPRSKSRGVADEDRLVSLLNDLFDNNYYAKIEEEFGYIFYYYIIFGFFLIFCFNFVLLYKYFFWSESERISQKYNNHYHYFMERGGELDLLGSIYNYIRLYYRRRLYILSLNELKLETTKSSFFKYFRLDNIVYKSDIYKSLEFKYRFFTQKRIKHRVKNYSCLVDLSWYEAYQFFYLKSWILIFYYLDGRKCTFSQKRFNSDWEFEDYFKDLEKCEEENEKIDDLKYFGYHDRISTSNFYKALNLDKVYITGLFEYDDLDYLEGIVQRKTRYEWTKEFKGSQKLIYYGLGKTLLQDNFLYDAKFDALPESLDKYIIKDLSYLEGKDLSNEVVTLSEMTQTEEYDEYQSRIDEALSGFLYVLDNRPLYLGLDLKGLKQLKLYDEDNLYTSDVRWDWRDGISYTDSEQFYNEEVYEEDIDEGSLNYENILKENEFKVTDIFLMKDIREGVEFNRSKSLLKLKIESAFDQLHLYQRNHSFSQIDRDYYENFIKEYLNDLPAYQYQDKIGILGDNAGLDDDISNIFKDGKFNTRILNYDDEGFDLKSLTNQVDSYEKDSGDRKPHSFFYDKMNIKYVNDLDQELNVYNSIDDKYEFNQNLLKKFSKNPDLNKKHQYKHKKDSLIKYNYVENVLNNYSEDLDYYDLKNDYSFANDLDYDSLKNSIIKEFEGRGIKVDKDFEKLIQDVYSQVAGLETLKVFLKDDKKVLEDLDLLDDDDDDDDDDVEVDDGGDEMYSVLTEEELLEYEKFDPYSLYGFEDGELDSISEEEFYNYSPRHFSAWSLDYEEEDEEEDDTDDLSQEHTFVLIEEEDLASYHEKVKAFTSEILNFIDLYDMSHEISEIGLTKVGYSYKRIFELNYSNTISYKFDEDSLMRRHDWLDDIIEEEYDQILKNKFKQTLKKFIIGGTVNTNSVERDEIPHLLSLEDPDLLDDLIFDRLSVESSFKEPESLEEVEEYFREREIRKEREKKQKKRAENQKKKNKYSVSMELGIDESYSGVDVDDITKHPYYDVDGNDNREMSYKLSPNTVDRDIELGDDTHYKNFGYESGLKLVFSHFFLMVSGLFLTSEDCFHIYFSNIPLFDNIIFNRFSLIYFQTCYLDVEYDYIIRQASSYLSLFDYQSDLEFDDLVERIAVKNDKRMKLIDKELRLHMHDFCDSIYFNFSDLKHLFYTLYFFFTGFSLYFINFIVSNVIGEPFLDIFVAYILKNYFNIDGFLLLSKGLFVTKILIYGWIFIVFLLIFIYFITKKRKI